MIAQCLLVAAVAAVVTSVTVSQEEYARYISQQQLQRLQEDKQPENNGQPIRRPVLVQVVPSGSRQPSYQPALQPAAYQPQPAAYQPQPASYQPQPASYQPQSASYQPQAYLQQPDEYQQPEQQYQPPARAQAPRPKAPPKPKALNRPDRPEDEESDNNPNAQYQFSFDISDDESTNYHNRKEQRDGEKISGSYSVVDSDGFIRTVTYTADPEEGFKAEVSREPTNIQVKIPTPAPQPAAPGPQYRLQAERKPQPQYIAVQAGEPESAAQSAEPISGYYRPVPQQVKALAPVHRFAASPSPSRSQQQAGSKAAGYAPTGSPLLYQAYQQQ